MTNYNTETEVWKDVKGYEGIYQISSIGRLKSLKRKYVTKDKIIKGTETSDGYKQVQLKKHQTIETRLMNSLLKEHFSDIFMKNENVVCATCNKQLHRKPSEIKRNVTGFFFCSAECDAIFRSEKMLEKSLTIIKSRIKTPDFENWLYKKYVVEKLNTMEISELMYGKSRNEASVLNWLRKFNIPVRESGIASGNKHWNYNPKKTDEERILNRRYPEYIKWRESVFERDNYTCKVCKQKGGQLNAHHLDGYDKFKELRTDLNNGITLCEECHDDFHAAYGRGNNTKEQFLEYKQQASN